MKRQLLNDADISARRSVNRRMLLRSIGVGAVAIAATIGAEAAGQRPTQPKPADPCRDTDTFVNDQDGGCPGEPIS